MSDLEKAVSIAFDRSGARPGGGVPAFGALMRWMDSGDSDADDQIEELAEDQHEALLFLFVLRCASVKHLCDAIQRNTAEQLIEAIDMHPPVSGE